MQTTHWILEKLCRPVGVSPGRPNGRGWLAGLLALLATLAGVRPATATAQTPTLTQSFTLQPGWNALWLQVKPTNGAPGAVFGGLPVESVWTFNTPASSAQFIQDPVEAEWNRSSWRVFVPTNRLESINNNLFAIQANRAYLVKLAGTVTGTLTLTGRPSLRPLTWEPDAFNLRGLPVDPAAPPTFVDFFRPSAAHYDAKLGQLQKITRLDAAGHWVQVAPTDTIRAGEALWIYAKGASAYQGPLEVDLEVGDGLVFDTTVEEFTVRVRNLSATPFVATLGDVSGLANPALAYAWQGVTTGTEWIGLPGALPLSLAAGATQPVRIAIRRAAFNTSSYGTVVAINSGTGSRVLLPVSAAKVIAGGAGVGSSSGRARPAGVARPASAQEDAIALAGLWTGKVQLDAVNEVNSPTDKALPTATPSPFSLNLLLHVDASGQTRLLREVIQLFDPGTTTVDTNGVTVTLTPVREVLLTEDSLVTQFEPLFPRDGQAVGRRLSTSSYDFDTAAGNFLPLTGYFGGSQTLTGTITLSPSFPTNPFLHRYHPDHDNLDATFTSFKQEAYPVVRQLSLTFSTTPPTGTPVADYGYQTIGGTYRETISGLHRENLVVQGKFLLHRASTTAVLNQ